MGQKAYRVARRQQLSPVRLSLRKTNAGARPCPSRSGNCGLDQRVSTGNILCPSWLFRCGPIAAFPGFSSRLCEHSSRYMHLGSQQAKTKIPSFLAESDTGTYFVKLKGGIGESKRPNVEISSPSVCVISKYKSRGIDSREAHILQLTHHTSHPAATESYFKQLPPSTLENNNNQKKKR